MSVTVARAGPVTTAHLTGEIDIYTTPDVQAALQEIEVAPGGVVVVDLREVTFLDSSGIGAVIGLHRRAARHGGHVRVVCVGAILRLVRLMHLDEVLEVVTDLEHPPGTSVPSPTDP